MNEERAREEEGPDEADEALIGSAGADVSAGIAVSGVGGEKLGESDDEETPLDDVVDGASRTAYGRRGRPDDEWGGA